jgi:DNA-directed RNA polymerase specialized sigma24 family protein
MTPDPTRFTPAIDAKIRGVARGFWENQSGMSHEDYEDICQEGRLACWQWLTRNPLETLGMGLVRVLTVSAARDFERSMRRHAITEGLPDWHDEGADPTQEYETVLADILAKIVNDESEAAIAVLIVYEGLTHREAAEHLNIPKATVQRTVALLQERASEMGITS